MGEHVFGAGGKMNLVELVNSIELVVADIDGTLVDSGERNNGAAIFFVAHFGLESDDEFRKYLLAHSAVSVAQRLTELLDREVLPDEVNKVYLQGYRSSVQPISVFDGAVDALCHFHGLGKFVAAATAADEEIYGINKRLLQETLHQKTGNGSLLFHAEVFQAPGIPNKPSPAALEYLLAQIRQRISGKKILVVGDSRNDELFAQNIGAHFVHITREYTIGQFAGDISGNAYRT